jgi:chorismate mutase
MQNSLDGYRKSIDRIDSALLYLLAERFRVTENVGEFKKEHGLQGLDENRRKKQYERLEQIANDADLDLGLAKRFSEFIHQEVLKRHQEIRGS